MNFIQKSIIGFVFILFVMWNLPMEANAELSEYASLKVAGTVMIENGEVKKSVIEDGMGGSVVYDENTNTLTLNNFHYIEIKDNNIAIIGTYLGETEKLHVVLKGTNDLRRSERIYENASLENTAMKFDGDVVLEGSGKLITNTRIAFEKVEIKDCILEIQGLVQGLYCTNGLVVDNADITIGVDEYSLQKTALMVAVEGKVEIRNSSVKVKGKEGQINSFMSRIVDGSESILKDYDKWIVLGEDTVVTDGAGNELNICGYKWANRYFFCFSKDGENGTWLNDSKSVANVVYIESKSKLAMTAKIKEVQSLIDAIGTVQLTSEEKIKAARTAYDSLADLGDKEAYAKGQITNYQILLDAETTYDTLVQEEKKRLEAEEEARRQAEKEKEERERAEREQAERERQANQDSKEVKDKIITVKNKKYVIQTPKLKSAKSKKKKTVTLSFTTSKKNNGYQISYAQNKNFKKAKKVTLKNKKSKKATIKKLKSKKTYYVRIRACRKINGKTYYGNWSNVKKVRVK